MEKSPDFIADATNVYRTKEYIVNQVVGLKYHDLGNVIFSLDTYYLRTQRRDEQYEKLFADRRHIDGKRLPTSMYMRTYKD